MRRGLIVLVIALACLIAGGAQAATAASWFDWQASRDGKSHTYAAGGFTLTLSVTRAKGEIPKPLLTIRGAGAPELTLTGETGFEDPAALVGVARLDAKAARPQVLLLSYSGGAHCCTTLKLAILVGHAWRAYTLTFDGDTDKSVVDWATGAPVLRIGDGAFDYTFASHAGSYLVERFYAVRGGRLYDVSGESQFAAVRRKAMAETLADCGDTTADADRNGACAAYVAEASLAGQHGAAWQRMLGLYDKTGNQWESGCRIDTGARDCPKDQTIAFNTYPAALAWFLWRNGYWPAAPTFACVGLNCPVDWPKTPAP